MVVLRIITVCFNIGAFALRTGGLVGCLSIDGGRGLSLAGTIGSFSLNKKIITLAINV